MPQKNTTAKAVLRLLLSFSLFPLFGSAANNEVQLRILDRLGFFFSEPVTTLTFLSTLLENGGFDHNLEGSDRDDFLVTVHSLPQTVIYYGMETGVIVGVYSGLFYYREPGNSGYNIDDPEKQKYFQHACVSYNGQPTECLHEPGDQYIRQDSTSLVPCPDEHSQRNCSSFSAAAEEQTNCTSQIKWCQTYTIEEVQENENLGYIPTTYHCHDQFGRITEQSGTVVPNFVTQNTTLEGDCYHLDGSTPVNRSYIQGDYAYCDGNNCTNTFLGGFMVHNYDARYRPWYQQTKEMQVPIWSEPYPFVGSELHYGITYTRPIYDTDEQGRKTFAGVFALDFTLADITDFLVESYGDSPIEVVIYEAKEPYFVIGASTGSPVTTKHLSDDVNQPCPEDDSEVECTSVRTTMANFSQGHHPMDDILVRAFHQHNDAGYPNALLSVLASDDIESDFFVSQSAYYEQPESINLNWRIIITSPGEKSTDDAPIASENPRLFSILCIIAGIGVIICAFFCTYFYGNRMERAIIHSDWRFTCAFLAGCAFLNLSSFTMLGPNTNATCLLRIWSFHFFFTATLSPLFVKVWRLSVLGAALRRKTITNYQATMYTLPLIVIQVAILIIFTIVDPPVPTVMIEEGDGTKIQRIVCQADTNAFFIVEVIFEAGLIFIGCFLAYKSRNLDQTFNEVKEMIFSMYNIAVVGIILVVIFLVADLDGNGKSVLQGVGVFWGSVCSSSAFVLPRLLQAKSDSIARHSRHGRPVRISGINFSGASDMVSVDFPSSEHYASRRTEQSPNPTKPCSGSLSRSFDTKEAGNGNLSRSFNTNEVDDKDQEEAPRKAYLEEFVVPLKDNTKENNVYHHNT